MPTFYMTRPPCAVMTLPPYCPRPLQPNTSNTCARMAYPTCLLAGTAMLTLTTTFGVKAISLQGGGIINGSMLQAGLIDELSLVVYPGIDGMSGSTSIFEYTGNEIAPAKGQSLELLSATTRQHGVLWLRYKFHKS